MLINIYWLTLALVLILAVQGMLIVWVNRLAHEVAELKKQRRSQPAVRPKRDPIKDFETL